MKKYTLEQIVDVAPIDAIEFYIASEADAERADMRAGFALELASKDARIAELDRYVNILESQHDRETLKWCIAKRNEKSVL